MTEILCLRTASGAFVPLDDDEAEKIKRIKAGSVTRLTAVQVRNGGFHRKYFALVKIAFDLWAERQPAIEYKGQPVKPEKDRFRRDLLILCGFYRPVFAVNGEMRLEAESISFASMTQGRFEAVFSQTINVVLEKILSGSGLTEEKLREHVDMVMRFDS
jgi:hypothetical protein